MCLKGRNGSPTQLVPITPCGGSNLVFAICAFLLTGTSGQSFPPIELVSRLDVMLPVLGFLYRSTCASLHSQRKSGTDGKNSPHSGEKREPGTDTNWCIRIHLRKLFISTGSIAALSDIHRDSLRLALTSDPLHPLTSDCFQLSLNLKLLIF